MKLTLALVFLRLIAFQVTDSRHVSGIPMEDGAAIQDDLVPEMTLHNDRDTGNTSTGPVEGPNQRNSSTNVTFMGSDTAGKDFVSNVSISVKDPAKKETTFFHDNPEGTAVVFIIAIVIALLFLSPAFNHCRKSYKCGKQVSKPAELDFPPRYQELLQRDELYNLTVNSEQSLLGNLRSPCHTISG